MAYGLKYELLVTSKKGNLYKAKLFFDGYTGYPIDRNVPASSPFVLRKDKADVIRGTSFEFSIREEVDFEFLEFYTNNQKKVRVDLYSGSTLIWTGYNLPQQYQVPYVPSPIDVRFIATDGLGLMKNERSYLTGLHSQLEIIKYCVDKTGLTLGYSIAVNLFETTHNHSSSPLAQTYIDTSIIYERSCYEIVEEILGVTNEITQCNGRWHITSIADKKSSRMLYTSEGVYEGTAVAQAVLDLGYPNVNGIEVWPSGQLVMDLEPGGNKVAITHDFGKKDSFLSNYDFRKISSNVFNNWTNYLANTGLLTQGKTGDKYFAFLASWSNQDESIRQSVAVTNIEGQVFVFRMLFSAIGYRTNSTGIVPIQMQVRVSVKITDGVTTYYLSKTGWTLTPTKLLLDVTSSPAAPAFIPLILFTAGLPLTSGTLQVDLYKYRTTGVMLGDTITGIAFADISVSFLNNGEEYPAMLKTNAHFDNSTEVSDLGEITMLAADAPGFANDSVRYENILRISNGSPTTVWHWLGSGSTYTYIIQTARALASINRIARQKLTGTVKGNGILFNSIIKHSYNSNREFEIAEGSWDLYEEKWDVTLLELLTWSDETITFTSITELAGSDTSKQTNNGSIVGITIGNAGGPSINNWFEEQEGGYLLCKLPFASTGEIQAFTDSGQMPADVWQGMPIASATVLGGIKVGSGLAIADGVLSAMGTSNTYQDSIVNTAGTVNLVGDAAAPGNSKMYGTNGSGTRGWYNVPSSMVYPGSGIPLSTGSAWGASIADNSGNWNTAYIDRMKWDGGSTGLTAATGRTSLGLGTAALSATGDFATAAQGTNARVASDVYVWAKAATKPSYSASEVGLGNVTNESKTTMFASPAFTGTARSTGPLYITIAGPGRYASFTENQNNIDENYENYITVGGYAEISGNPLVLGHHFNGAGSYGYLELLNGTRAIAIRSNGNIGIGTTTPSEKLSVAGNIIATGEVTAYYSSDARLKENIQKFSGLDIINNIQPVKFKWNDTAKELNKSKDDRDNYGLIAQEVEGVLPELIHPIYDEYKAVDYIQLVPILIQAIKEQNKKINELEKLINYTSL